MASGMQIAVLRDFAPFLVDPKRRGKGSGHHVRTARSLRRLCPSLERSEGWVPYNLEDSGE